MLYRLNGRKFNFINTNGNKPCSRSRVSHTVADDSLYIYGGTGSED